MWCISCVLCRCKKRLPADNLADDDKTKAADDDDVIFMGVVEPPAKKRAVTLPAVKDRQSGGQSTIGLFTFMATCLLVLSPAYATQGNYNVTNFETNPGIYFEDVAKGSVVVSEWKLMVYFDLEKYWMEYDGYRVILNKLGLLCDKTGQFAYCNEILNQFRYDLMNIQETNRQIFSNKNYTFGTQKAGLV